MKISLVDLKKQYQNIKDEIDGTLSEVIDSAVFIKGKHVEKFENDFASYCTVKHAIGSSSGTTALHLALLASGVKPGDEVITVPNTFIATTEAIGHCGAKPLFVDIDPKTYCMDPSNLKRTIEKTASYDKASGCLTNKITKARISAVIPVHLFGHPADMKEILKIAKEFNLKVIEDAAQAHSASITDDENGIRRTGSIGDAAAFSFFPGKNLGAYGDAGMVTTNDDVIAQKVRLLSDHGRIEKYEHLIEGYNYRLDSLQAAILSVKLKHLDEWTEKRRKNADIYSKLLKDKNIVLPEEAPESKHVYHLYVIRVKNRDGLQKHLQEAGIATGIHYKLPLHLQPAYKSLGYKKGDFPVTEMCSEEMLSLPMYPELSEDEINFVCTSVICSLAKSS